MTAAQHVQLTSLILGRPGEDVLAARRVASEAAASAGRTDLVEQARSTARDWVLQSFAQRGYSGTWAATEMTVSVARPADRTAVAEALADAVTADVVEDLIDPETADVLRSSWTLLAGSAAIPEPGGLDSLTRSIGRIGAGSGPGTRPGTGATLVGGVVLVVVGCFGFAIDSVAGVAFLVGGLLVIASALLDRRR
jgi:hypothetical protein